jgi:hypothetical protein
MFDKPLDIANLTQEQRYLLDDLYEVRAELSMRGIEANNLKRMVLRNPCTATELALAEYLSIFVRPLADRQNELQTKLWKSMIDKSKLMEMLPMILAVANNVVDLRLVIELLDMETESGNPIATWIQMIISGDIPTT